MVKQAGRVKGGRTYDSLEQGYAHVRQERLAAQVADQQEGSN